MITPNIDSLVTDGTSFIRAHIPGGTCSAVCMPSRAMLHTGRSLFHIQNEGQEIPAEHTLLGEFLQSADYLCFGIGKWHNGSSSYARSFTAGDEIFFGGMWDHWNVPAHHYDPTGQYAEKVPYISDAFHSREVDIMQTDHITPGRHSTDLFADTAVDFLEKTPADKPFFLNVAFMAPTIHGRCRRSTRKCSIRRPLTYRTTSHRNTASTSASALCGMKS